MTEERSITGIEVTTGEAPDGEYLEKKCISEIEIYSLLGLRVNLGGQTPALRAPPFKRGQTTPYGDALLK